MQSTAFGVGRMLCFSLVSTIDGLDFDLTQFVDRGRRLWPPDSDTIAWPAPILFDAEADAVADSFGRFVASPMMEWRDFPK
jgi:hypothetical protein